MDRVVVAGGSHSSSTSPRSTRRIPGTDDWTDWFSPTHRDRPDAPNMDMSITVGWNAAVEAGVTREEMNRMILNGFASAFLPWPEKQALIAGVRPELEEAA